MSYVGRAGAGDEVSMQGREVLRFRRQISVSCHGDSDDDDDMEEDDVTTSQREELSELSQRRHVGFTRSIM